MPWRCLFDCSQKRCDYPFPHNFLSKSYRNCIPFQYHDYDWIPTAPVPDAWPERLLGDAEDTETDFIRRYCESQERDDGYRPRRLLLIDPSRVSESEDG